MRRLGHARLAIVVLAAACVLDGRVVAGTQPPDVASLMAGIGGRVAAYYHRAQSVVCIETSTTQPIDRNWSPEGFARTVESELHVEAQAPAGDALPDATVVREIRRVNGRPPRESDQTSRNACTDPNPLSPEPLAFLLPTRQHEYRFTSVHAGRERDRPAFIVDFMSSERTSRPELVEDGRGHDDCFDWTGPMATRGRLWVDAETHDVLRLERGLPGPVDVRVPTRLQRRYSFGPYVVLDRDDATMHFRPVVDWID